MNNKFNTRKLVVLAMLTAISVVLVTFVHFPIFPAAMFLEYDPADIPILISTFAFGPVSGLMVTVAVSIIQALTVSAASGGWIGAIMHIVSTGSFVLVSGNIYKKHRTMKGAIIALIFGVITMVAVMTGWNLVMTPLFMGAEIEQVIDMLLPIIIPFNAIKAGVNAIVTFLLYKSIHKIIVGFIEL